MIKFIKKSHMSNIQFPFKSFLQNLTYSLYDIHRMFLMIRNSLRDIRLCGKTVTVVFNILLITKYKSVMQNTFVLQEIIKENFHS